MRRAFVLICTAAIVAAGFAAITAAPAGAAPLAYTIEINRDSEGGCRLATVDVATGTINGIGSFLAYDSYVCANDLAFGPNGILYGISDNEANVEGGEVGESGMKGIPVTEYEVHLVTFDTTSGAVTDVGRVGTEEASLTGREGAGGITFDGAGNLFVSMVGITDACDDDAFCLYGVDPTTPANATLIGPMLFQTYFFGLTSTCSTVYSGFQSDDFETTLSSVNTATAGITGIGTGMGPLLEMISLEIDPATGTLHGLGMSPANGFGGESVYTIDATTGVATAGPNVTTLVMGLAIGAPNCVVPTPPPPPAAPPAVIPTFTG